MIYPKGRPNMNTYRTMSIFFSLNRYDFNISIICGLTAGLSEGHYIMPYIMIKSISINSNPTNNNNNNNNNNNDNNNNNNRLYNFVKNTNKSNK